MTKSFTAATILLLRDEGRLRLDDPVAAHVPALEGWAAPTADAGPITIRHLLTMSAGLPTDDPWGDRQQALAARRVRRAAPRAGPLVAWTPGRRSTTRTSATGSSDALSRPSPATEYGDVVRDAAAAPAGPGLVRLPRGRGRRRATWRTATSRRGRRRSSARAATCTAPSPRWAASTRRSRTSRRWVAWLPRRGPGPRRPGGRHRLRRASRREMQQAHRVFGAELDGPRRPRRAGGRGRRLRLRPGGDVRRGARDHDQPRGRLPGLRVVHGLAPGERASGSSALGNLRYASPRDLVDRQLAALVAADGVVAAAGPAVRSDRGVPARRHGAARGWDDAVADACVRDEHGPRPAAARAAGRRRRPR